MTGPKYLIHVIQEKSMIRKAKPCELSCPDARECAGPACGGAGGGSSTQAAPNATRASGQRVKLTQTELYI